MSIRLGLKNSLQQLIFVSVFTDLTKIFDDLIAKYDFVKKIDNIFTKDGISLENLPDYDETEIINYSSVNKKNINDDLNKLINKYYEYTDKCFQIYVHVDFNHNKKLLFINDIERKITLTVQYDVNFNYKDNAKKDKIDINSSPEGEYYNKFKKWKAIINPILELDPTNFDEIQTQFDLLLKKCDYKEDKLCDLFTFPMDMNQDIIEYILETENLKKEFPMFEFGIRGKIKKAYINFNNYHNIKNGNGGKLCNILT